MANLVSFVKDQLFPIAQKVYIKIAFAALLLANAVSWLGHFDEFRKFVLRFFSFDDWLLGHFIIAAVVAAALLLGYAILALWVYKTYFETAARKKRIFFAGATAIGVIAIVCLNFWIVVPASPDVRKQLQSLQKDLTEIVRAQQNTTDPEEGGFRFARKGGPQEAQVWTTAQAIFALENAPSGLENAPSRLQDSVSIRAAFKYIEALRIATSENIPCNLPSLSQLGWGYVKYLPWGVTEINSWVVLARLRALSLNDELHLWDKSEIVDIVRLVKQDLQAIAERQHSVDGGWGPIQRTDDATHLRTYSTVMAVWALSAARENSFIKVELGNRYDRAITAGVNWLIVSYIKENGGWIPNPSLQEHQRWFPGLTAHAIYVLDLVMKQFPYLASVPDLKDIKQNFIRAAAGEIGGHAALRTKRMEDNEHLHDSDRYLQGQPYTAEQMTFLWYPWTLMAMNKLRNDTSISKSDQILASTLAFSLLRQSETLRKFAEQQTITYPSAEGLLAINTTLADKLPAVGWRRLLESVGL